LTSGKVRRIFPGGDGLQGVDVLREIQSGPGLEQHIEVIRAALNIGDLNPEGLRYVVNLGFQEIHIPIIDIDRSPVLDALHKMVVQGIA
jgi:hypothetical protein